MRREGLVNLMITGMVEGRRGIGRPRKKHIDGLVELVGGGTTRGQFITRTMNKDAWRSMVADVLEDMAQR